jgi:hypothetical protein
MYVKRIGLLVFILTVFLAFGQTKPGTPITVVGEVIDTQCYLSGATGPGKGARHKECAINCAKGGIPIGILEEKSGTVYFTGQTKLAMTTANVILIDYVADRVRVTGRLVEKGGAKMILIDKVEKLPIQ